MLQPTSQNIAPINLPRHGTKTLLLIGETVAVGALLATLSWLTATGFDGWQRIVLLMPLVVAQGIWFDRAYTVAHEGVHRKLIPHNLFINDLLATILLLPIAAPLTIYRKIHFFHHGSNRRDFLTAALDSFVVNRPVTPGRRLYYRAVWIFYVFFGGFFLHSFVTILLFLVVPHGTARRIDPVFNGWRASARLRAWGEFLLGLGFHTTIFLWLGPDLWLVLLGLPLAAFAWVWSLLLYVYHYDTTVGRDVRHNVRSLPRNPLLAWIFLNFNEHATHHYDPSIPWYLLPSHRHSLPDEFASNQSVDSLHDAIWQQRRGPRIVERRDVVKEPRQEGDAA